MSDDAYNTPEWVVHALVPHLPRRAIKVIYEPAPGSGQMVAALRKAGLWRVIPGQGDFLSLRVLPESVDAILTNPPYGQGAAFIEHALALIKPRDGLVAMLLRTDFDHAATRAHLFGNCPMFARKVVLTRRIRWFADSHGSPSFNHGWFIWDVHQAGLPTITYAPIVKFGLIHKAA